MKVEMVVSSHLVNILCLCIPMTSSNPLPLFQYIQPPFLHSLDYPMQRIQLTLNDVCVHTNNPIT